MTQLNFLRHIFVALGILYNYWTDFAGWCLWMDDISGGLWCCHPNGFSHEEPWCQSCNQSCSFQDSMYWKIYLQLI